jgi:hypothetical protein
MKIAKRVITNAAAPDLAQYVQGKVLTGGAELYGYQKPVTWPLYTLWGIGVRTLNQFNIVQPAQLFTRLALTNAPIVGAGVPSGSIEFQGLIDEGDD